MPLLYLTTLLPGFRNCIPLFPFSLVSKKLASFLLPYYLATAKQFAYLLKVDPLSLQKAGDLTKNF